MCRRLRSHPEGKDIPVLFITALSGVENDVRGFEIGAADYISKLSDADILEAKMRT